MSCGRSASDRGVRIISRVRTRRPALRKPVSTGMTSYEQQSRCYIVRRTRRSNDVLAGFRQTDGRLQRCSESFTETKTLSYDVSYTKTRLYHVAARGMSARAFCLRVPSFLFLVLFCFFFVTAPPELKEKVKMHESFDPRPAKVIVVVRVP